MNKTIVRIVRKHLMEHFSKIVLDAGADPEGPNERNDILVRQLVDAQVKYWGDFNEKTILDYVALFVSMKPK